jgi:hypothetical protein
MSGPESIPAGALFSSFERIARFERRGAWTDGEIA